VRHLDACFQLLEGHAEGRREKSVVAHLHEPLREHVLQKAPDEFLNGQGHRPAPVAVDLGVGEAHPVLVHVHNELVGNRDLEDVAGEIGEWGGGIAHRLAVHVPGDLERLLGYLGEEPRALDRIAKLPAKHGRERVHRQIEARARCMPLPVLGRERTAWHDVVDVGVVLESGVHRRFQDDAPQAARA